MKTLSERINFEYGNTEDAWVMKDVKQINAYEILCLICADLNIDLSQITDSDFDSCAIIIDEFCKGSNDRTGYTVSVWFDN